MGFFQSNRGAPATTGPFKAFRAHSKAGLCTAPHEAERNASNDQFEKCFAKLESKRTIN
jgi:hypothetical protein